MLWGGGWQQYKTTQILFFTHVMWGTAVMQGDGRYPGWQCTNSSYLFCFGAVDRSACRCYCRGQSVERLQDCRLPICHRRCLVGLLFEARTWRGQQVVSTHVTRMWERGRQPGHLLKTLQLKGSMLTSSCLFSSVLAPPPPYPTTYHHHHHHQ